MNVVVLYGTEHRGSTYHIAQRFLQHGKDHIENVTEFFLPKDMPKFCVGCAQCIMKGAERCPHRPWIEPIEKAIQEADLLIFTSPVYVFHASGQMKALLDHFGYWWLIHRPEQTMYQKTALVIATAAGGGMKSTIQDIKHSLQYWGVGKIFSFGKAVASINWEGVAGEKKEKIEAEAKALSRTIMRRALRHKPSLSAKMRFEVFRLIQKKGRYNAIDVSYWTEKGWFLQKRPWK